MTHSTETFPGRIWPPSPGERPPIDPYEEKATRLELIVSYLLRIGVALSLAVTFVGLVLLLSTDPSEAVVRQTGGFNPQTPATVFADLLRLRPKAIIDAGLTR